MKTTLLWLNLFACVYFPYGMPANAAEEINTDICIYGATSAGVIAAYSAAKLGKKVILVDPGMHTGGLTSGGLGYTDIGNKYAISGLSLDFYRRLGKHYGKFEQWIFEPHVAENLFKDYLNRAAIKPLYRNELAQVSKEGNKITSITVKQIGEGGAITETVINAGVFIDCTYEGDLMAMAGITYIVGREANLSYKETYNGVQLRDKHQFPDGIDPFRIKGQPESGLLWGISIEPLAQEGSGDNKIQAYNFRICLTDSQANSIPITRPDNYDSTRYELLVRLLEKEPGTPFNKIMKPDLMTNRKTDINNNGPFSTDMIGMNYNYADGNWQVRKNIQKAHEDYNKGFLYFIGHDPRIPEHLRNEMLRWGYPKDEYVNNGHWSPQMYVREARRMQGSYVMTQANCEGREKITDGVGMAAYTMDSHNCQRIVIEKNGVRMVKNEGDVQIGGFPPYPISYRSIIPKKQECGNLFVPVCLSATHIAYGSIRMEPVFMVLAQSAAYAAVMAIDNKQDIQDLDVAKLQQQLQANPLADNSTPDILIDNEDNRVSVTGSWEKNTDSKNAYGVSSYRIRSSGGKATVKFSTPVPEEKNYHVYVYLPKISGASTRLTMNISNGSEKIKKQINLKNFQVAGQTSGEWIHAGNYNFKKGDGAFVEITDRDADGIVVADAVVLVPMR